jgi:hypothetical protein
MTLENDISQELCATLEHIDRINQSITDLQAQAESTKSAWARAQIRELIRNKEQRLRTLKLQVQGILVTNS